MGIARPNLNALEMNEISGSITLGSLQKAADALECELRYVLVPKCSLSETVRKQALHRAQQKLSRVNQSQALEASAMVPASLSQAIADLAQELEVQRPTDLWNDWGDNWSAERGDSPRWPLRVVAQGNHKERVPIELGRVAMEFNREWNNIDDGGILPFIAKYHHKLVWVHPFNNGNGRWSRLACDVVVKRLAKMPSITWATDTLTVESDERSIYISALKAADEFNYDPLTNYLATLNPNHQHKPS
jgi:hypothetical protein